MFVKQIILCAYNVYMDVKWTRLRCHRACHKFVKPNFYLFIFFVIIILFNFLKFNKRFDEIKMIYLWLFRF